MNIGIITFIDANNYGALLQSYALKNKIEDKSNKITFLVTGQRKRKSIKWVIKHFFKLYRIYQYNSMFVKTRNDIFNIIKIENSFEMEEFDAIIVGSDQVWNSAIIHENEEFFFLENVQKPIKISYAATFGNMKSRYSKDFLKTKLNFNSISVRDSFTLDRIEESCNLKAELVCDPVFLLEKEDIDCLINKSKLKKLPERYILTYCLSSSDDQELIVSSLQSKLKIPVISIVSVGHHYWYYSKADSKIMNASLYDWLKLFKNASFVFTESFHGLSFSIIFRKNFIGYMQKNRSDRLVDLATIYNLTDRLVTDYSDYSKKEVINEIIDWSYVNNRIEKEKMKADNFIVTALALKK